MHGISRARPHFIESSSCAWLADVHRSISMLSTQLASSSCEWDVLKLSSAFFCECAANLQYTRTESLNKTASPIAHGTSTEAHTHATNAATPLTLHTDYTTHEHTNAVVIGGLLWPFRCYSTHSHSCVLSNGYMDMAYGWQHFPAFP